MCVCVSHCNSHRDRKNRTLILQVYHSDCYWCDVLQLLDERLARGGKGSRQGWREGADRCNVKKICSLFHADQLRISSENVLDIYHYIFRLKQTVWRKVITEQLVYVSLVPAEDMTDLIQSSVFFSAPVMSHTKTTQSYSVKKHYLPLAGSAEMMWSADTTPSFRLIYKHKHSHVVWNQPGHTHTTTTQTQFSFPVWRLGSDTVTSSSYIFHTIVSQLSRGWVLSDMSLSECREEEEKEIQGCWWWGVKKTPRPCLSQKMTKHLTEKYKCQPHGTVNNIIYTSFCRKPEYLDVSWQSVWTKSVNQ